MTWILIVAAWTGAGQAPVAIHSIEFNSREACDTAADVFVNSEAIKLVLPHGKVMVACRPKGES